MRTIWKYPFKIHDRFSLDMPKGAKVLHAQSQNMAPHLWALVDPSVPTVKRWFRVFGTGSEIDSKIDFVDDLDEGDRLSYVCTFSMAGAQMIWHLFEEV